MVKAKFIYRKSDNLFIGGGFYDAQPPMVAGPNDPVTGQATQVPDFVNFGVVEFGDADVPDLVLDRYDPATGGKRRATAQELAAAKDAEVRDHAERTADQKDMLTMLAYLIRRQNVAAWDAMSAADKRTTVRAQAVIWRDLRVLTEKF